MELIHHLVETFDGTKKQLLAKSTISRAKSAHLQLSADLTE